MVNNCMIIGRLGRDPETRYTQSGSPVCSFKIACSEKYKDASGNMQENTEWVPIVAWGKLAEICSQYLHKGSKVYLEGKLRTLKWHDKEGGTRYTTEIVAREMKMLDSRRDSGQQQDQAWNPQAQRMVPEADVPF